ncbi:hypothetical protein K1719_034395 [Acacia pycnantha]|nr:hypothetical protein K1719_034395 [Acacia pycnantha]
MHLTQGLVVCFGIMQIYIRLAYPELGTARGMTTPIVISVLLGTILITASGYFLWKKMTKPKGEMVMQIEDKRRITDLKQIKTQELSLFDYRRLATVTNNFDLENKLGQGDFGPVYKRKLEDGQEIAVKRLKIIRTGGHISPQYAIEKSDVFSFGVLLLEIISGRKNNSFYEDAESYPL